MNFCKPGSVNLGDYMNFAMNFCAGNLNECPFITAMSIYFRFSKNGHSLSKKKNSIGHAKISVNFCTNSTHFLHLVRNGRQR
jgi:hypothetical protein